MTWAGTEYDWTSPVILGLGFVGVALLVAFVFQERRATEPIMPLRLFRDANSRVATSAGFIVGLTLMDAETSRTTASFYMFVVGTGIGLVMQVLVLQPAAPRTRLRLGEPQHRRTAGEPG